MKRCFLAVFLSLLLLPRLGEGRTAAFSSFDLWPAVGERHFFTTSSSQNLYRYQFTFDLANVFLWRPLDLRNPAGTRVRSVVDYSLGHFVSAGFGITDFWQLGVSAPFFSLARFELPIDPSTGPETVWDLGDLRVTTKIRAVDSNRHRWGLAFEPFVVVPIFDADEHYLGDSSVYGGISVIGDVLLTERIRLALNLGPEIRPEEIRINNISFSHRFFTGLGLSAGLGRGWTASAEGQVHTAFSDFFSDRDSTPVEFLGGVQWEVGESGVSLGIGGGTCVVCGAKGARARGFLNLGYRRRTESYALKEREEADLRVVTLEGGKGEKETLEEEILILKERCPTDPGEFDPQIHDAGCPKFFELKQGVTEGFSPQEREVVLALQQKDEDGDKIADAFDACPADPEDFNGVADTDGCPEGGIKVTTEQIWTTAPVHFAFNKVAITRESALILSSLVEALFYHPEITTLKIVGHTDIIGTPEANDRISRKRAEEVVKFLRSCGVPEGIRLIAQGVGAREPVAPNDTAEGRQQNRRVIFKVVSERAPESAPESLPGSLP